MLSHEAFAQMKTGVRIVNCARGELVDEAALLEAHRQPAKSPARRSTFSAMEPPPAGFPLFALEGVLATPHIGGSTEEAQEIVGVRIAEQVVEYLQNGVAINAVNMPALVARAIQGAGPLRRRWRSGWATSRRTSPPGNPHSVRLHLLRQASPIATPACCAMRAWPAC